MQWLMFTTAWLQQVAEQHRSGAEGQRWHVTTLQSSVFGCKQQLTGGTINRCLCRGKAVAIGIALPSHGSVAVDNSDDNNVTATQRESGGGNGITLW